MNDTSPEIEAFLKARYAAMSGSDRALMALQMFETAQKIVLSSLDPALTERQRRREAQDRQLHLAAHHVADRLAAALVRNVREINARLQLDHLHPEMLRSSLCR